MSAPYMELASPVTDIVADISSNDTDNNHDNVSSGVDVQYVELVQVTLTIQLLVHITFARNVQKECMENCQFVPLLQ